MYSLDDTIVAVSSPPGGAARGIVRLSGPQIGACLQRVFQLEGRRPPWPCRRPVAVAGSLALPDIASLLPCRLYLWPHGRSYTGEPVAELHTLGSPPLLEALVNVLCAAGARVAGPGEFTLRAFLAGRIDLPQAEAVLGVIDAADPGQLDVALAQLAGGLSRPLSRLRDVLLELLAELEAGFDFPDEDLPLVTSAELKQQIGEAARAVAKLAGQMAARTHTSPAIRAVLVGRPNTGKSSLFNALICDTGALVTEQPGTTRDYLTADVDLEGVKCQLVDTAGVAGQPHAGAGDAEGEAQSRPSVEQAAQEVSARQRRQAAVRIFCLDSTRPPGDWEREQLARYAGAEHVVVLTTIDLCTGVCRSVPPYAVPTSSVTGEGIDALRGGLRRAVLTAGAAGAGVVGDTAVRCRESLRRAAECLKRARKVALDDAGEELVAAEVRVALDELGKVVGAVYTDEVLDRIFSRFCIGK